MNRIKRIQSGGFMRTTYALAAILSWVFCCSVGMASTVHARVWHVFADSTGDAPFLAAAIDSAQDGDAIELGVGDFPVLGHYLTIEKKSLELTGQGMGSTRILGGLEVRYTESFAMSMIRIEPALPDRELLALYLVDRVDLENCAFAHGTFENRIAGSLSASIVGCHFEFNRSVVTGIGGGGGLTVYGIQPLEGPIQIVDCVFDGNRSPNGTPEKGYGGGGLHLQVGFGGEALVSGCVFSNNEALSGGGAFCGRLKSSIRVINNTFVGNKSHDGALYAWGGVTEVYGNIFIANEGFGLWYDSIDEACNCNIYWANRQSSQGQQWFGPCFYPNGGSQVIDPQLCNRRMGDYHIAMTSPALPDNYPQGFIDAGCSGVIGALEIGCDRVPTVDVSWGAIKRRFLPEEPSGRGDDGHD